MMLVEGDGKIGSVTALLYNKLFADKMENHKLKKTAYVQFLNENFLETLDKINDEN